VNIEITQNNDFLGYKYSQLGLRQGVLIRGYKNCTHGLNSLIGCFISFEDQVPNKTLYYSLYNPGLTNTSMINFQREVSNLSISVWDLFSKNFTPVYSEAFCFLSPESNVTNICDIYVN
jgi:hypothetical protein